MQVTKKIKSFRYITFLLSLVFCFGAQSAWAQSENSFDETYYPILVPLDDPFVFILFGEIDIRTSINFKRAVLQYGAPEVIILDSPGGIVQIGLDVALEVNRLGITTYVPEEAACYSACSFIFFAGQRRILEGDLGLHQISSSDQDLERGQIALSDIIDVLNLFKTPPQVYALMLRTPPSEIYILSRSEIEDFNLNDGINQSNRGAPTQEEVGFLLTELEEEARELMISIQEVFSSERVDARDLVFSYYLPRVDYYGNQWDRSEILEDKFAFLERWPSRNYQVKTDSIRVTCLSEDFCRVSGIVVWSVSSAARNASAMGESFFEYDLRFDGQRLMIAREDSMVVTRR